MLPVETGWQIHYFNAPSRRRKKSLKMTKHMCEMKLRRQAFHFMENTQRWWNPYTDECAYVVEVYMSDGGPVLRK